jgi:hypothetical protein
MINIDPATCTFNWYCEDVYTGSACFDKNYQYVNFPDSDSISIEADQLWADGTYNFKVIVVDSVSGTTDTRTCSMHSAPEDSPGNVIDVFMESESNTMGYINL